MTESNLVVTNNNGDTFTVTGSEDLILNFLKWISFYKRGEYDKENNIVLCKTPLDMKACTMKACRMNLYTTKKLQKA